MAFEKIKVANPIVEMDGNYDFCLFVGLIGSVWKLREVAIVYMRFSFRKLLRCSFGVNIRGFETT